ncbi:MAG: recombination-associated protein RdgC [Enterobacterales bacterium]|nr:recombination-associated protein RdgC [Enterobacterales bacterium]
MWFKNCHIYRLPADFSIQAGQLEQQLQARIFRPCAAMVDKTQGWVAPLGRESEMLTHSVNGCLLVCLRKEQKVIPASVVKETMEEKVFEEQQRLGRKIYRTEKLRLKDDILASLLPKAFVRASHTFGYFDIKNKWLLIDSSSATQVDDFYQMLVDSMGSFGASPFMSDGNPSDILNQWVLEQPPSLFELKGEYWLKDLRQDRVAQFKDLDGENLFVADLIKDGYTTQRLGIIFEDQLSVAIQDTMQLKRIKFSDQLLQENKDIDDEDPLHRFDADFVLMTSSLAKLINHLQQLFGIDPSA